MDLSIDPAASITAIRMDSLALFHSLSMPENKRDGGRRRDHVVRSSLFAGYIQ